ncbi:class I SAM-dependent methyltransferase [Oscillochloris sp. ZM17-4]|uniref:class I SAM-dependent methyltransferase n=1 Tax=Oscillochloris sp. ZM17-4 TaxID=2866714 RepID=UPI001C73396F|nr:class I SAM-dependent methyltransferase [Oscillochloris sp. ZM17-4]MBX0328222.1 class I SAM-dependent methyltransferase [Oscillochloris sp. ZM17-4]
MAQQPSLGEFLQAIPTKAPQASILQQRFEGLGIDPASSLYTKTALIVRAIDGLFATYGSLERYHAEWIQGWVLEQLTPAEFKEMAQIVFQSWVTPERLEGPGIPHIHKANDAIGAAIVAYAKRTRWPLHVLDLGAGTLGTTGHIAARLAQAGMAAHISAVEFTPALLAIAGERAARINQQAAAIQVAIINADMVGYLSQAESASVDFVTCSYALHHLHPTDQLATISAAYRCLRPGGAFLIADPQEGKSDFNLKVLLCEEPEAVFAIFSSPEQMAARLRETGFAPVEVLLRDDEHYTGYAVAGRLAS